MSLPLRTSVQALCIAESMKYKQLVQPKDVADTESSQSMTTYSIGLIISKWVNYQNSSVKKSLTKQTR